MGLTREACCPVLTMPSYLPYCQAKPAAPLFHFSSGRPLSARRLRSTIHSLLHQNGYNPGNYNTHSFRIRAATAAARAGLPPATIKQLCRWCSDATPRMSATRQTTPPLQHRLPGLPNCFLPIICCVCNPHLFVYYHTT